METYTLRGLERQEREDSLDIQPAQIVNKMGVIPEDERIHLDEQQPGLSRHKTCLDIAAILHHNRRLSSFLVVAGYIRTVHRSFCSRVETVFDGDVNGEFPCEGELFQIPECSRISKLRLSTPEL